MGKRSHRPKGDTYVPKKTRRRIIYALRTWDSPNSKARARFEAARAQTNKILQPMLDAIEASQNITEVDLCIVVR